MLNHLEWRRLAQMLSSQLQKKEFFHQQLEQRVLDQGDRTAISYSIDDKKITLSYSELNAKVNQLANHLIQLKTQKWTGIDKPLIGLFFTNSPAYVISMLAVMKSGMSFVALSAKADRERLSLYLEDLPLNWVIIDNSYKNDLFVLDKFRDIFWAYNENDLIDQLSSNPNVAMSLQQLAYIHNTSGSSSDAKVTKKVLISHSGILNCAKGLFETLHVINEDQVGAFSDISFDAHIADIMTGLGAGACLHIIFEEYREIKKLEEYIVHEKITVITLTPRIIEALIQFSEGAWIKQLRVLLCTGESVSKETVKICLEANHNLWFVNGYGPAETTIATTLGIFKYGDPELQSEGPLSIGNPIGDLRLHILEEDPTNNKPFKKVSPEIEGELCISGSGLALGYAHPILTKERFVDGLDPDNSSQSMRLYRTRDRAKYAFQNNSMHFFVTGRLDKLIKNSAEQIDPEEIEKNMVASGARAARLKKLFSGEGFHSFAAALQVDDYFDLYEFYVKVRAKLPAATSIVEWHLHKNPIINNSGKTAFIESKMPQRAHSHAPQKLTTKAEEISDIWREILKFEATTKFTIDDNFYLLGGTSILTQRMVTLLRRKYNINLSITEFNKSPTIGYLERMIDRQQSMKPIMEPILLNFHTSNYVENNNLPLFLIHSIIGNAQNDYEALIDKNFTDRKVFGINARPIANDESGMDTSLYAIAQDYIHSIKSKRKQGPYLLAGWSSGGVIAYIIAQILQSRGEIVFLHIIDSTSYRVAQQNSRKEYAYSLVELFKIRLADYFSIKLNEKTYENLLPLPKTKQIYTLIAEIEKLLPNDSSRSYKQKELLTIRGILLAVLHFIPTHRVENATLWLASDSKHELKQKNFPNDGTLGWSKDLIEFTDVHEITGGHFNIIQNSAFFKQFEDVCRVQTVPSLKEIKESLLEEKQLTPPKTKIPKEVKKWALPTMLPYHVERPQLEAAIGGLFNESEEKEGKAICVLMAEGGWGKTSLANFIVNNSNKAIKVWFDSADTVSDLIMQYRNLAEYLAIYDENTIKSIPDTVLIQKVKDYFEGRKDWIIVYDNAENYLSLDSFLPQKGGQILITSRPGSWPKNYILPLDAMEIDECSDLIKIITKSKEKQFRIQFLAEALEKIPFAISQACAYIYANNTTVTDYVNQYEKHSAQQASSTQIPLPMPIWKTWDINIKFIESKSPAAINILQLCSLLDPVGIPVSFIKKLLEERGINTQQFDTAKQLLIDYYLIRFDTKNNKFSIHRLIQEVTCYQFSADIRSNLLRGLARFFITELDNNEDQILLKQRELISHFIHLLDDVMKDAQYDLIFARALELGSRILSRLNGKINLVKAMSYLDKSLEMNKQLLGSGRSEIIIHGLVSSATLLWEIQGKDNLAKAAAKYKEALTLAANNEFFKADILHGLGNLHYACRETQTAIDYFEQALEIKRRLFGPEDKRVGRSLYTLGGAYWDLRGKSNFEKCIEYSLQALTISEKLPPDERDNQLTIIRCNLGIAHHDLGGEANIEIARGYLNKALEAKDMIRNHPGMGLCSFYLGLCLLKTNDSDAGIDHIDEGISIIQKQVIAEHRFVKYVQEHFKELNILLSSCNTEKAVKLQNKIKIFNEWGNQTNNLPTISDAKESLFSVKYKAPESVSNVNENVNRGTKK